MKLFYKKLSLAAVAAVTVLTLVPEAGNSQQAVSGIVTDFNSFWKSSASAINAVKPNNSHNLLAFTYNSKQYSTGVNDGALTARNENFIAADFWSLPVDAISGRMTGNTKIGLGELYDGVHTGPTNTPPAREIKSYLTDGIKGLDIGTCVANLPSGNITFLVSNIRAANIGDGIPDILVTQVADPSGQNDRYSFVDNAGNVVGITKEISFTAIPAIANWTADFYEASTNPITLTPGFTNTDRNIRLWAADLSDFGITAANYLQIGKFKIDLNGNSDVAFVAYNNRTFSVGSQILPVTLTDFTAKASNINAILNWKTDTEKNSKMFVIERSNNNRDFTAIDSVAGKGYSTEKQSYTTTDKNLSAGNYFYRLQMVDNDGRFEYSKTVQVQINNKGLSLSVYPNPASSQITVSYPSQAQQLQVIDTRGVQVRQLALSTQSTQATLDISSLSKGVYHLVLTGTNERLSQTFVVK